MSELLSLLPSGGVPRFIWDLVWQSTLLGVVALAFLRFFVKQPAARAWFAVLATGLCVLIPLVSLVVRANGLGMLSSESPVVEATPEATFARGMRPVIEAPSEPMIEDALPVSEYVADTIDEPQPVAVLASEPMASVASSQSPGSLDAAWLWKGGVTIATASWAILAMLGLFRLIKSMVSVRRLCREAVDCDNVMILGSCRRAARALGLRREPQVAISPQTGCPTVLAWGRPKLFIPPLSGDKSAHQWFSVFSHELAHVQRGDGWSKLAMELAAVLLPWQPLIRLLQSEHRQACEEACDDWALFAGADPFDFASALTEWIPTEPNVGALDVGIGTSSIRKRIERLLRCSSTPQPRLGGGWLAGGGMLAIGALFLLALMQAGATRTQADDRPAASSPAIDKADRIEGPSEASAIVAEERIRALPQLVAVLGEGRMQHWNSAEVLGFGPQQRSVYSLGLDGTLKVWDLETGSELRGLNLPPSCTGYRWWDWELERRRQYCIDVLLSPDGKVVFVAMADGTVELLDSLTFELQRTLTIPGELPKKFALSADGKRLASIRLTTADDACAAVVVDIASGDLVGSIKSDIPDELLGTASAPWRCLALSPDGSKLAVGRNGDATVWDVASGNLLREVGGGWLLQFSPDGNTLVACTPDQHLKLWDVTTGDEQISIRSFATSSQVAFDPAGDLLAIVDRSRVRLCRAETGEQLWMSNRYSPSRHFSHPTVAFHNDGKLIAASSGHGVVLFDTASGNEIEQDGVTELTSLAVAPTGGEVATGDSDGQLATWDIASGEQRRTWPAHELGISPLAYSPDGKTLASAAFEHLVVWDAARGSLRHTLQPKQARRSSSPMPLQMAFTPDSASLLVGHQTRELTTWSIADGNPEGMLQVSPTLLTNAPFATTRDNHLLANARGEPRGLGIWNLETGKQTKSLARYGGQMRFAVSFDGRRIAAGERGNKISLWDQENGKRIEIENGHLPGYLRALAFSPNGQTLASGADDGKVQLWHAANGDKIDTLQVGPRRGIIDQLAFSSDGRYLISKNGNGTATVLQVGPVLLAKE